ncbi:MAG: acetyl esterase [Bifidobacteriaceae bacterium]|nr:acetyl esterase [Bifidobacteriaceae bacterium]MCI1915088.1 acetyl esterase [Bifidobacteriaceae bacterium]
MANTIDVLSQLSPDMKKALDKQNELSKDLYAPGQSFEEMRAAYNHEREYWNQDGPVLAHVDDRSVSTSYGEVRVRMYRPNDEPILPVIVYIHGGGWVLGNVDTHDRITRILAKESGAAVVSVDYTLSPEAKYPQGVEECVAVVQELRNHSQLWGIDPHDISFAGDSGGANMSFATYLHLREEEKAAEGIRCMLLIYGWYGLRDSGSLRLLGGPWDGLTSADFDMYKNYYFASPQDAYAPYVDILSNDLTHDVPPLYIAAGGLDPLQDDSKTLAKVCEDSGIPYRFELVEGVLHGFIHHSRVVAAAREVLEHAAAFYKTSGVHR